MRAGCCGSRQSRVRQPPPPPFLLAFNYGRHYVLIETKLNRRDYRRRRRRRPRAYGRCKHDGQTRRGKRLVSAPRLPVRASASQRLSSSARAFRSHPARARSRFFRHQYYRDPRPHTAEPVFRLTRSFSLSTATPVSLGTRPTTPVGCLIPPGKYDYYLHAIDRSHLLAHLR